MRTNPPSGHWRRKAQQTWQVLLSLTCFRARRKQRKQPASVAVDGNKSVTPAARRLPPEYAEKSAPVPVAVSGHPQEGLSTPDPEKRYQQRQRASRKIPPPARPLPPGPRIDPIVPTTIAAPPPRVQPEASHLEPIKRPSIPRVKTPGQHLVTLYESTRPEDRRRSTRSSLLVHPPSSIKSPQMARLSVASDSTTGTLNRYLANRRVMRTNVEKSLRNGMSISRYEREGSWVVNHPLTEDNKYNCPLPCCDAHNAVRRSSNRQYSHHTQEKHRPTVHTVYEVARH